MAKINFTQEHFNRMQHLLLGMLMNNGVIHTKIGSPLDVVALLHTTTINTLNDIRHKLAKQIEKLEDADEWIQVEEVQDRLEDFKIQKELVNLVIGYKRFMFERDQAEAKKSLLREKIAEMKEAQKTPEDKLKEAEAELAALEEEQL